MTQRGLEESGVELMPEHRADKTKIIHFSRRPEREGDGVRGSLTASPGVNLKIGGKGCAHAARGSLKGSQIGNSEFV